MQSNFCPLSRLAAHHHNRSQAWHRILRSILGGVLKGFVLIGLVVGALRATVQLRSWLSLHDLQVAALLKDGWLEPSATSILGVCIALNIAWVMNLLKTPKLWQRRLVGAFSWLAVVGFVSVMSPLSQQLGQVVLRRSSTFGLAEASFWGMIMVTVSLVWLSALVLLTLLVTQIFGFTHVTDRIRHTLAALVGLHVPTPALARTSEGV